MEQKTFEFTYMMMKIKVTTDDQWVTVKQGLRSWTVAIADLKYLYIIDREGVGREMILAYEKIPGKLKRVRVNAFFGEAGFNNLLDHLLALRPDIDIRDLPSKEAHKLMKAPDVVNLTLGIMTLAFTGIMAIISAPWFIHGLDSGEQTINAGECALVCNVETRNLNVRGYLAIAFAIEETTENDYDVSIDYYIPLVPFDWEPEDPVFLVLKTPDISESEFDILAKMDAIPCVLRDILWEGLGNERKTFFAAWCPRTHPLSVFYKM